MSKTIFLELNEFNADLLKKASQELPLKNIEKMLSLNHSTTFTEDTYESDFLEPWVQWVSVHTGKPSSVHKIKHLGDVPHLDTKQIWEHLSDEGITSGVWGAMNASRNGAEKCKFFLPDPWTASEIAYPEELNNLLDPLRYISKNYLNTSPAKLFKKLKNLCNLFSANQLWKPIRKELPTLMKNAIKYRAKPFVFIGFVEYLSTLLFLKYQEKHDTEFSSIFINTLAHIQHHYWKDESCKGPIAYGLTIVDKILGELFAHMQPGDILMVSNALSQKNTNEETPWILYRQLDQKAFLETVGVQNFRVESHMTHDAHIFFGDETSCQKAKAILENATIQGQKLFLVEDYPEDPKKLFYRICFTDEIPKESLFHINGKTLSFFNLFKPIVKRTGKHIPYGSLYTNKKNIPELIKNHEILNYVFS